MKKRWILVCLVFLVGLILILIPVASNIKARKVEGKLISDFNKSKSEAQVNNSSISSNSSTKDNNEDGVKPRHNENAIALIKINAIGLEAPIVEGENNLNYTVGKYTNSADFGAYGNTILAAHNNMAGSIFRDLKDVNVGEIITIETKRNIFNYKVTDKIVVEPNDSSVLKENMREKEITLITCTNHAKERLIVKGSLVNG